MDSPLWLIPAFPLLGFALLAIFGLHLPRRVVSIIGVGSVGASAITAALSGVSFISAAAAIRQTLWTWIQVGSFQPKIGLHLDELSLVMILVITFVGFLIHLYSTEYMAEDEGYARFFAYMNLFTAAMLILVMADNLVLLYLGWEGVGLCSYLLIGFWYKDPANARAAMKAFIVTRIGDTFFIIGLLLLFSAAGTLNIQELLHKLPSIWTVGGFTAVVAALLVLGGAVGKSAQVPLQVWLPDAMAGPTPVSALIHAATMVTAGVYLIARLNVVFTLAPPIQLAVAIIGALTLLLAGFSAMVQTDIKRALAYSTMSQIGYMFLALGVGAWSAAIFHFASHAFFKALLFLAAGVIIENLHHEQNMLKMGGLRDKLPFVFWIFLIGSASLAAVPLVTSGFYSKDYILWAAWAAPGGNPVLWACGAVGAILTAWYSFRMVFLVFFGKAKIMPSGKVGVAFKIPLFILAIFSVFFGFIQVPFAHIEIFSDFVEKALPATGITAGAHLETILAVIAGALTFLGIFIAYYLYVRRPATGRAIQESPPGAAMISLWHQGWGFDWLYGFLFVNPFMWIAKTGRRDLADLISTYTSRAAQSLSRALSATQTGITRDYAAGLAIGAILAIAAVVLL
jgi:NADH-quinone oxidoreductase subunit L